MYRHTKSAPNDGVHIDRIVETTTCEKHKAEAGVACWHVFQTTRAILSPAICGSRIKKAGFIGEITSLSLARSSAPKHGPYKK